MRLRNASRRLTEAAALLLVAHTLPFLGLGLLLLRLSSLPRIDETIALPLGPLCLLATQLALGVGLMIVSRRPPSPAARLMLLTGAGFLLLSTPFGLTLGLMTCGLGSVLHGGAVGLGVLALRDLLHRDLVVGLRRWEEEEAEG